MHVDPSHLPRSRVRISDERAFREEPIGLGFRSGYTNQLRQRPRLADPLISTGFGTGIPSKAKNMGMTARTSGPAVLVVEDEWAVRVTISMYLHEAGCRVYEAASGEVAVDVLQNADVIDVVFTDLRLGGRLNGWDVGEAARANRVQVAVIYTSGHPIEPQRPVEGSVFLGKPYDPAAVMDACKTLCSADR